MKKLNPIVLLFTLYLSACQEEDYRTPAPPEKVVQKYQEFIDQNRFSAAKALSTQSGKELIDQLAASIDPGLLDSTILETQFHRIHCEVQRDKALCWCDLEDQYERYEALFSLIQIKGRWLVDAPESEPSLDLQEVDEIVEEIIESKIINQ